MCRCVFSHFFCNSNVCRFLIKEKKKIFYFVSLEFLFLFALTTLLKLDA